MKTLAILLVTAILLPASACAAIYVKIPGIPGDVTAQGYEGGDWFIADSFSFGVDRELKESGEKGGTEDINIGVGELQLCTISKAWNQASTRLMQFAINGNSTGTAEIHFVTFDGTGRPRPYLIVKLDRCFVKSWSTSGDADDRPTEEVAFYYNRIAFQYYHSTDGGVTYTNGGTAAWDNVKNTPWTEHGIPSDPPD